MALAVPSTDHAAGRIPNSHISAKPTQKESPPVRGGGFPARAARCLSLLLYSPAQDGKHIKCFPLRAELATNLNSGPPGPGIRHACRGNVPFQIGTGLFWSVLSGETSRSSGDLLSSVAWKSAAFPFNAKEAASPSRKRPQILRIDDGKGLFRFGLSC